MVTAMQQLIRTADQGRQDRAEARPVGPLVWHGSMVTAPCQGVAELHPYTPRIWMWPEGPATATCTCPDARHHPDVTCKHVVSLARAAMGAPVAPAIREADEDLFDRFGD